MCMPHRSPDPFNSWLSMVRFLTIIAAMVCLTGITTLLLRRAKRPHTDFQRMLIQQLTLGAATGFGCALQYVLFASAAERAALASLLAGN